jgi:hypothetical protein
LPYIKKDNDAVDDSIKSVIKECNDFLSKIWGYLMLNQIKIINEIIVILCLFYSLLVVLIDIIFSNKKWYWYALEFITACILYKKLNRGILWLWVEFIVTNQNLKLFI